MRRRVNIGDIQVSMDVKGDEEFLYLKEKKALVIGGGVSGIIAALNLAELGVKTYLVEKSPSIGGCMSKLDKTFPTLDCSICILAPFMTDVARHPNIELLTYSDVEDIRKSGAGYRVKIRKKPRYVLPDRCKGCGDCTKVCPVAFPSEYDNYMGVRKAAYIPFPQAVPLVWVIDYEKCMKCGLCKIVCEPDAIDFNQKEEEEELYVDSVIIATGLKPHIPSKRTEYGYGKYKNVILSIELERLLNASGPTLGSVVRPSDGKHPKRIAFINCVGSRDRYGKEYCSKICCMYGIKEAILIKEHDPAAEVYIFYMDIRAPGKGYEEFYKRAAQEHGVKFIRARPTRILETEKGNLIIKYENTLKGEVEELEVELVVLNVALEPPEDIEKFAEFLNTELNAYRFFNFNGFSLDTNLDGIYLCGSITGPCDISDAVTQGIAVAAKASAVAGGRIYPIEKKVPVVEEWKKPRIGVFVCHCGLNIASVVDVQKVAEYAKKLPDVVYAEDQLFSCSEDSLRRIVEKIKEHKLTRVIVAACTPKTHDPTFRRALEDANLNPFFFEMANIRNQCSWVHQHEPEKATKKSMDLVRMAVAKARLLEPLEKIEVPVKDAALIIGGGVTGISAAQALLKNKFNVILVEKEPYLGGHLPKLSKVYPSGKDAMELYHELVGDLFNHSGETTNFTCITNARVKDISGYVGNFIVTLDVNNCVSDSCTLCGKCAEVCPVEVPDEFNYRRGTRKAIYYREGLYPRKYTIDTNSCTKCGKCTEVCEAKAINLEANNQIQLNVGTIIIATGCKPYDPSINNDYGYNDHPDIITSYELERLLSENGPTTGKIVTSKNTAPSTIVFISCVGNMEPPNDYCSKICCINILKQAKMIKEKLSDAKIYVLYKEMRSYGFYEKEYLDAQRMGIRFIRFNEKPTISPRDGGIHVKVRSEFTKDDIEIQADLVVLSVGFTSREDSKELAKMTKIGINPNGFYQEAHIKLAPVDTSVDGIYIAGAAHYPKDIEESIIQGLAAATRAMIPMAKGKVSIEPITAEVNKELCIGCGICERVCPYKAARLNREEKKAEVIQALCKGCGTCAAECPTGAMQQRNFRDEQIFAMIDAALEGWECG